MLQIVNKLDISVTVDFTMTLPYDIRQKSRFLGVIDEGEEVAVKLARGTILRHGDVIQAETGECIRINAALETVSIARADEYLDFSRACYHLGNRHVPLQIEDKVLRYQSDHVLDEMVRRLGLTVHTENSIFEPESGAYHGHGH